MPPRGLLDPTLYRKAAPEPAWQRAARLFGDFTDNYVGRPVADATAMTLGLPGDAYLAASKLVGLPLGLNPEEVDRGYGRHVMPTSGDFQRLMAPLFESTPPPSSASGRIAQAGLTGLASLPMGGEAPSLLALLREGVGGALPQAANEATDNAGVRLAAGLLPMLLGSTKKVRTLPGIGEVGPAMFKATRMATTTNPNSLVYLNPSFDQVRAMIDRDQWKTARYVQVPNGDVYVWPAGDANHDEMLGRLGEDRTKARGTYFIDPTDGEIKMGRN